MHNVILQEILETKVPVLPDDFSVYSRQFSAGKWLYDFQERAMENALRGLYLFYQDLGGIGDIGSAKSKMVDLYREYVGSSFSELQMNLSSVKDEEFERMVLEYMNVLPEDVQITGRGKKKNVDIPFKYFANRMAFWMATGSGKTLIIVELIDALFRLMEKGLIPKKDILFLAPRPYLLSQFEDHMRDYAEYHGRYYDLVSLKDYGRYKQNASLSFKLPVFYYESHNLMWKTRDKQIDFRNYENGGNWYVILDEAHRGESDVSKQKYIFSIMARNGFMFNFSATFVDDIDYISTAYEYNLATFIENGHGKHIVVFNEDVPLSPNSRRKKKKQIKEDVDGKAERKQKRVMLKMLILLSALRKRYKELKERVGEDIYHSPLAMVLTNTVSGSKSDKQQEVKAWEESDMKLFIYLLSRISSKSGWDDVDLKEIAKEAMDDLVHFMDDQRKKKRGADSIVFDAHVDDVLKGIGKDFLKEIGKTPEQIFQSIYEYVFNAKTPGSIEIIVPQKSKDREIVLKLTTSDRPFALIRIGSSGVNNVKKWLVEKMGYVEGKDVVTDSYFDTLNDKPEISLLLGSRSFYEGWDSSRPNIIMFVGVGKNTANKKYILQSIGRGVRIEPVKNKRKRKWFLCREDGSYPVCRLFASEVFPIETLFIWGSRADVIATIVESMNEQKEAEGYPLDFVRENVTDEERSFMFVPVYQVDKVIIPEKPSKKFVISKNEWNTLKQLYEGKVIDREFHRVITEDFLAFHFFTDRRDISPKEAINLFANILRDDKVAKRWLNIKENSVQDRNIMHLIDDFFNHIVKVAKLHSHYVDISEVADKIRHFKHIRVKVKDKEDWEKIQRKVEDDKDHVEEELVDLDREIERIKAELQARFSEELLDRWHKLKSRRDDIEKEQKVIKISVNTKDGEKAEIIVRKDLIRHYYVPVVMADDEKHKVLKNAITYKSEIKFIEELSEHMEDIEDVVDTWKFSKIVENVDDIYIPYFKDEEKGLHKFYPDFIFWFKKGSDILVVFVDPKGTEHTDAYRKIDGYRNLFESDGEPRIFAKGHFNIRFALFMYGEKGKVPEQYKSYWIGSVSELVENIKSLM